MAKMFRGCAGGVVVIYNRQISERAAATSLAAAPKQSRGGRLEHGLSREDTRCRTSNSPCCNGFAQIR